MKKAIYPGSFDPLTLGHVDIIKRASSIVDELVVGVLNNSAKNSLFSLDERVSMIEEMTKDLPNVSVTSFDGLLVEHMKQIEDLDLDGYAIGGLAVGESAQEMYRIIEAVEPYMPEEKPRYLMGVGTPVNILEAVYRGIDLFDCVMPSRNARHGHLFTWAGIRNLNNAKYILDDQPIDEACDCPICQNYSRAYLHHLFKANEMLGMRLAVMHNIYFYNTLLEKIRFALDQGQFEAFYRQHRESLALRI